MKDPLYELRSSQTAYVSYRNGSYSVTVERQTESGSEIVESVEGFDYEQAGSWADLVAVRVIDQSGDGSAH